MLFLLVTLTLINALTVPGTCQTPAKPAPSVPPTLDQDPNAVTDAFGGCGAPSIVYQEGMPGRQAGEFVFSPSGGRDGVYGGQGVALNFAIIMEFICLRYQDECRISSSVNAPAFSKCDAAKAAGLAAGGVDGGKCSNNEACGQAKIDAFINGLSA